MARRTTCLCDGEYIGIETIYTIVNGRQINIPDKVEALREKSRQNKLKCTCGCGALLTLVAGDRNLREQHFRLKDGEVEKECHMVTEGKCSVDSKVVLKCWLDDKLKSTNIESRVPIYDVEENKRKYEFTLLDRSKSIAISYFHKRVNISDDKLDILESNSKDINIIYIVDELNGGVYCQYPESLMKIHIRQGYCLYLSIEERDYYKAVLKAVYFDQDIDGYWQEVTLAMGPISQFDIADDGNLFFKGQSLSYLKEHEKEKYESDKQTIKLKRAQEEKEREEREKAFREEEAKRQEERRKELERKREEAEKLKIEQAEKKRKEAELAEKEKIEKSAKFIANCKNIDNLETQVIDADGNRVVKCEFCGKIANVKDFSSYGGMGKRINLGTCNECSKNNPVVYEKCKNNIGNSRTLYDPNICPQCGGQLKEKIGAYGLFMGCVNYPKCRFTRQNNAKKR